MDCCPSPSAGSYGNISVKVTPSLRSTSSSEMSPVMVARELVLPIALIHLFLFFNYEVVWGSFVWFSSLISPLYIILLLRTNQLRNCLCTVYDIRSPLEKKRLYCSRVQVPSMANWNYFSKYNLRTTREYTPQV